MKTFLKRLSLAVVFVLVLTCAAAFWLIRNPLIGSVTLAPEARPPVAELKADVAALAAITPSRSFGNPASLDKAAEYIREEFRRTGCDLVEQPFPMKGTVFRNISCASATFGSSSVRDRTRW